MLAYKFEHEQIFDLVQTNKKLYSNMNGAYVKIQDNSLRFDDHKNGESMRL